MSAAIEDRLSAALEARADLVKADDLRPLALPDHQARPHRWTVVALSAAAAALVVAGSIALARTVNDSAGPGPTGQPSTTPTHPTEPSDSTQTPPSSGIPDGMIVVDHQRADLDGDGRVDQVRVAVNTRDYDEKGGMVEATLAAGGTSTAPLPPGYTPRLLAPLDLNGDGQEQVLLSYTAGGDEAPLLVYTWYDGGLVRARHGGSAPLALGLDGEGTYADYYRDDGGVLVSWLRDYPVKPAGRPIFAVDQWSWAIDGAQLIATPIGKACVDVTSQQSPGPCD
jgi:hypothetical protein